jgi:hypothetical protein
MDIGSPSLARLEESFKKVKFIELANWVTLEELPSADV